MWWLLLPLSSSTIFHKSYVTVLGGKIIDSSPHFLYQKTLCEWFTSHINISIIYSISKKILCHSLLQQKIDCSRLISTISTFNQYGFPRSSTAQRRAALWRASASDLRRRSGSWPLQCLYDHMTIPCIGV